MIRALVLVAVLVAAPAHAATIVLDFEEETAGSYREGFVSSECACVHLYGVAPNGESLDPPDPPDPDLGLLVEFFDEVRFFPDPPRFERVPTDGQAILVGHEGARLVMQFLIPVVGVSLDFGNDLLVQELCVPEDPVCRLPDATLTGVDAEGGILAQSVIIPNRDLFVNQTISIASDSPIAKAVFSFRQFGEDEPEDFIVDNLVLTVPDANKERVTVCHKGRTLFVGGSALEVHLAHGDTDGACPGP